MDRLYSRYGNLILCLLQEFILITTGKPHLQFNAGSNYLYSAGAHGALLLFDLGSRVTYRDIPDYYR